MAYVSGVSVGVGVGVKVVVVVIVGEAVGVVVGVSCGEVKVVSVGVDVGVGDAVGVCTVAVGDRVGVAWAGGTNVAVWGVAVGEPRRVVGEGGMFCPVGDGEGRMLWPEGATVGLPGRLGVGEAGDRGPGLPNGSSCTSTSGVAI